MDINYELYKVFFYVAQSLSFSEASKHLYISQSAVSQSIKTLERKLGQPLFTLNLTAAYRSLWYARFGQGSSISLPKVMALHRRGSISHTGWSFDWNNPSMNYPYHRTFLCPVPYVHKVGIRGKNRKFPRLRKV